MSNLKLDQINEWSGWIYQNVASDGACRMASGSWFHRYGAI